MRTDIFCFCLVGCIVIAGCNNGETKENTKPDEMNNADKIKKELAVIDSLLQDKQFASDMAHILEDAYYKGTGETAPAFLKPGEDTLQIEKSVKEEKIATNIAGFYALECGINYLCDQNSSTPAEWIEKIIANNAGDSVLQILERFANATWKAGQPFRGLDRIKKPNFISWNKLGEEEVQKDNRQITGAAIKLKPLISGSKEEQLLQLKKLLQDKEFAYSMAADIDSTYYAGENKPVPAFFSKEEASAVKRKSFREEKIATNIAGFYAVECGVNYLVSIRSQTPSSILRSVTDNSISKADKMLLLRFANATWKAGQPFRSLARITREIFVPFNYLKDADIEKDWVQVKAAAEKILKELKQAFN